MGQTIPTVSKAEVEYVSDGLRLQAEFFLGKKELDEREINFVNHVAEIIASKNKWINFYENILHEGLTNNKKSI